jgi:site-specific recombinase XerD/ribosomal protein L40E
VPIKDYGQQLCAACTRIFANPDILKKNKEYVRDYIDHMKARGANVKTIHKHLYSIEFLLKVLGNRIDLKKADKKDLECVVAQVEAAKREDGTEYTSEHKVRTRTIIKAFYKHLLGDDLFYPPQVVWIKTTGKKSERVLPEDLLTEEDVYKMLDTAMNVRDKAIIALLYDSGIRMGELFSIRKKDISLETNPAHITVKGKTGPRKIPILFSVPYVAQYVNLIKLKKPEDLILMGMGVWINKEKEINYAAIRKILKVTAKKAKLNKRIYPHLFRHSRASYYANKLTEQLLKAYFGWTGDSHMAATYVHLSGRDVDSAIMQANGLKVESIITEPKLKAKRCYRCGLDNPVESTYCNRCGNGLEISTVMNAQEAEKRIEELMIESFNNPKIIEEVAHEYLRRQRDKRLGKR